MANPTTPAVARRECAQSIFEPEGVPWTAIPHDIPRGVARDALYAIVRAARGICRTNAPDRVLAHLAGLSVRSLQRGLKILEQLGKIERARRHGGRTITILIRLAGRKPKRPHRSAKASQSDLPGPSVPSSMRGKREETGSPARLSQGQPGEPEAWEPPCPAFTKFFARVCPAP